MTMIMINDKWSSKGHDLLTSGSYFTYFWPKGFMVFSGGIEWEHWPELGY